MKSAKSAPVKIVEKKLLQAALLAVLDRKVAALESSLSKAQATSAQWPELNRNALLLGDQRALDQAKQSRDAVARVLPNEPAHSHQLGDGTVLLMREDKRVTFYFMILGVKTVAETLVEGVRVMLSNGQPWSLFAPLSVGQTMELRSAQNKSEGLCEVLSIY